MQAYADYHEIMDLTEELIEAAALKVQGTTELQYQGQPLNLSRPFRRASMHDLVKDATGVLDAEAWIEGFLASGGASHLTRPLLQLTGSHWQCCMLSLPMLVAAVPAIASGP